MSNTARFAIVIVVIAIIGVGGYYIFRGTDNSAAGNVVNASGQENVSGLQQYVPANLGDLSVNEAVVQPTADDASANSNAADGSLGVATKPETAAYTISYNDSGFTPKSLTVAIGTTVTFQNDSAASMWVASDPHPTHTGLPGFDALGAIAPGKSYSYTFIKKGAWGYHDHLNIRETGSITVQ